MADSKDLQWITVNGKHIPIKPGQSKRDAMNEFFGSDRDNFDNNDEDIYKKEMKKSEEETVRLNTEEKENKEEPLHIKSLKEQVSHNPDYKKIADSLTDDKDTNEAYFYAFKDAYEKHGYEPSNQHIASELSDRYWELADSYRDRYGMSDAEWDRQGFSDFEESYGTEEEFIDKGLEAHNKYFDELEKEPNPMDEFSGPDREGPSYAELENMSLDDAKKLYEEGKISKGQLDDIAIRDFENKSQSAAEDKYNAYKEKGKSTWNQKLSKGDKVTFKDRSGNDITGYINGFYNRGELQDDDTYEEGKDNLWHDFRGLGLVDENGKEIGNINANQIVKHERVRNDLGTPEDFSKKTAKMPNGKEMSLFDFAHNIVNYLDTDIAAYIIASKFGISENDAKAYLQSPYNTEGSKADYERKLENSTKGK